MAATTDYDAPRRSTLEDEADTESPDALTAARADKQSPSWISTMAAPAKVWSCPAGDLSAEELTMPVVPMQADEFTCPSCFLLQHRSRLAARPGEPLICIDCA